VIPTSPLRNLEFPTKSQLQVGSLSTAFSTPLCSCFFPCGGKTDLYKLSHGSPQHPRVTNATMTASQSSSSQSLTKRISPQTWISHKSHKPQKEVLGELTKVYKCMGFVDGTSTRQRREGKAFILVPQKLAIVNYPDKTGTLGFGTETYGI
jgi:hypothetical protein